MPLPEDTILEERYRIDKLLAYGGMGAVYRAYDTNLQIEVAIKENYFRTPQAVEQFKREALMLARLRHPGLPRVLQHFTWEGQQYLVMEFIEGPNLWEMVKQRGGPFDEAQAMVWIDRVCSAVAYLHGQSPPIIHRDIKPQNVLVTVRGNERIPKIIDFGVAKATSQRLTENSVYTELGQFIGTPEYMSPEQADLTGLDVDTRTDVYSLGVVLYELLVGARPFDRKALLQAGLDEMRRKIREEEPAKPSTRIQSLGDGSTVSARNRKTEPRRLERELHGDLDCIAMKALEKDRTRRYGSPAELAADVGRHLRHEPVMAGPPSAAYRLRKFARRHRWGVAVAGLLTLTLVAGTAVSTWQAVRATRAERRAVLEAQAAARVSDFLSDLFRVSEPSEARGSSVTARELLDKGAKQIESELREQPELQARLMHVMGRAYESLGLYDQGELLLERALETRRRVLGGDHPDTLASMHSLGIVYWREGRYGEAERLYRDTIEARRRVLGEEHADTLATMNNLAALYVAQGRDEEAEALHEKTLEARRRVLGSDHPETLKSMHNLAGVRFGLGRVEEAEKLLQEVLKTQRGCSGTTTRRRSSA
jgi:tetratricopeptide (TPR) repeat protein/predicted Ser/Thr protein kinase